MTITVDRLTYRDINEVVYFSNGSLVSIVGVLLGIEDMHSKEGTKIGIIVHIGARYFPVTHEEMLNSRVTFLNYKG